MIMWYVFSEQPCRKTEDLHVCLLQPLTLLLELSCLHILSSLFDFFVQRLYGLRIISFDENSFNVPTTCTNNLNRTFLLVHYPFFNILKLVLRKAVLAGIHTVLGSFQCRGVLLLLHIVGQGPAVLVAGAGRVGYLFFFIIIIIIIIIHLPSISNVLSFGRRLNMTEIL